MNGRLDTSRYQFKTSIIILQLTARLTCMIVTLEELC
jgi:hypothetical protein